jgi:2-octaprenylphenol hydroxylase
MAVPESAPDSAAVDHDVIIVGAGIAGSALACGLLDSGLRVALVEANPLSPVLEAPAGGVNDFDRRVSAMTVASQSLLESLGVWEAIADTRACPYSHMSVWDADGTGAIDFDASEVDMAVLGHIVENRVISAALVSAVLSAEQVKIYNPARLESLQLDEGQYPHLELDTGEHLRCHLLVAADGAMSPVRKLAGFQTREWNYGHNALVCTVQTALPHRETAWQRFLSTGPLAFLPLPSIEDQNFCSIVWSADTERAEQLLALDDAAFAAELAPALEHRLGDILAVSPRVSFPLRQRHAIDYVMPGVALVGDAAHTIHPLAGQGINLGLQDVAVLSRELRAAVGRKQNPGDLQVLQRYQRQRKGENLLMMAAMDGFRRLFGQDQMPLRWLRNAGMRLVGRALPVKQQLMRHAMGLREG